MNDQESQELATILKDIRDHQKQQLDCQAEALKLQREQFKLIQKQAERHERIQDRAESIQEKGAQMVAVARKTLFFLLPVIVLLLIYVSWLIFR